MIGRIKQQWHGRINTKTPRTHRNGRTLGLNSLEQRLLPAQLIVTSSADDGSAGTFRSVLAIANTNNEADTVTFDAGVSIINLKTGQISLTTDPNNLTILGPGVTINGGPTATTTNRILRINVSAGNPTITISGLTIANGNLGNVQNGGAIQVYDETLVLDGVAFINNKATGRGGAISSESTIAAQIALTNCTFTNNQASSNGGAINADNTITINVDNCVFTGNAALSPGGGIHTGQSATITVNTSTFSKNTSNAGAAIRGTRTTLLTATNSVFGDNTVTGAGGAMEFPGFAGTKVEVNRCTFSGNVSGGIAGAFSVAAGACTITESTLANNSGVGGGALQFGSTKVDISNCTFSGNTSTGKTNTTGGGAILFGTAPNATIENTTITNNSSSHASTKGGGLFINSTSGTITLNSVLVAGNVNPNQRDLSASGLRSVAGSNNLIGAVNPAVINLTGANNPALIGSESMPIDPQVQPLANNGGSTETHLLKTTSPAVNAGVNMAGLVHDQRGAGFPRKVGSATDIGAVEIIPIVPWANALAPAVPPLLSNVTVTVVYEDDVAIDTASIDLADIRISGAAFDPPAAPISVNFTGGGKSVTATYTFDVPAGGWIWNHNGVYELVIQPNQVFDTDGPHAIVSEAVGQFDVTLPLPALLVDNVADIHDGNYSLGNLTLREAVNLTNFTLGMPDTIGFAGALAGQTITVNSSLPITDSLRLIGLGSDQLTINGGGKVRIFETNIVSSAGDILFEGLTITGGLASDNRGGALSIVDESVTLSKVKFTENSTTGSGGAIGVEGAAILNIDASTFQNNSAMDQGGAIYSAGAAAVTITGSLFSMNSAGGSGGAIRNVGQGPWSITRSTFTNNQALTSGGLDFDSTANVVIRASSITNNSSKNFAGGLGIKSPAFVSIESSTISGNVAATTGGGLWIDGDATVTMNNSTISGNTGTNAGGGLYLRSGTLTIYNSTIAKNQSPEAASQGGGIYRRNTGTLNLHSTIVADNAANGAGGIDLHSNSATTIGGGNNLVEHLSGGNVTLSGSNVTGVDPRLALLTNNGGTTWTHALLPGSPAFDQGSNPQALLEDQRGIGFPRLVGLTTDIGAIEGVSPIPNAQATLSDVPPVNATYSLVVEFNDDAGIDPNSIDLNDVRMTGGVLLAPLAPINVTLLNNGSQLKATYEFAPPGGSWDHTDNGQYIVTVMANQVFDINGPNAVPTEVLGAFRVQITPPILVVDNVGDIIDNDFGPGQLSLREAIHIANLAPGTSDTITFASSLVNQTITVLAPLAVTDTLSIQGLGLNQLTLSGGLQTRLFEVDFVSMGGGLFHLSGLKITGGKVGTESGGALATIDATVTLNQMLFDGNMTSSSGGAIHFENGVIEINDSTFTNNTASISAGAISLLGSVTVTVNNSEFFGNVAGINGGVFSTGFPIALTINDSSLANNQAGNGGAIRLGNDSSTVTINRSTFFANVASSGTGGGLNMVGGQLIVNDSTFNNNSAKTNGGAISITTATALVLNSTVSGNSALGTGTSGGGGFSLGTGHLTLNNSTITGNTSTGTGGGLRKSSAVGSLTLNSSIVAANSAATGPDIGFTPTTTLNVGGGNNLVGVAEGNFALAGQNQTGTAKTPLDPLIAPLADNGGPTKTHAVLAGSLAINRGGNTLNLEFDQRGAAYPRQAGTAIDIGAIEHPLPPVVSAIVIADGSAQRSMIRSITISLSEAVELPLGPVAALQLQRTGPGGPIGVVTFAAVQNGRTVVLTFADPVFAPAPGMSLIDGNYTLTLVAPNIQGAYATLDGNGDGIAGDDHTIQFHRLFGDSDGDRLVGAVDFNAFRLAYGGSNLSFDFNNDGVITALDFQEFRMRYGMMI